MCTNVYSSSRQRLRAIARHIQPLPYLLTFSFMLTMLQGGQAQTSNANWLTGPRADAFWNILGQAPYAQAGTHGLVVYMISYSNCPNCILFLRDFWEPRRSDIQLREIFAPVGQPRYLDEAADIAITRNAETAEAYYKRLRTAPPANSSTERRAALQRMEALIGQVNDFYRQIGHIKDGYPTFILRAKDTSGQDKLYVISGWGDANMTRDFDSWVRQASK